jgi:predicted glycosyltransferase
MRSRPTVLFHPLNHIGLGHINRLSVIAHSLKKIDQNVRTPFLIEGASHVLLDALDLPYLPLPASHCFGDGAGWQAWTAAEQSDLQFQIARSILSAIDPQVVVFDFLPSPALYRAVIEHQIPIVFCMREVRDFDRYFAEVRGMLEHVNLIVIPHPEGAFSLPEPFACKSRSVGQISRSVAPPRHTSHAKKIDVVITGGGGGYPSTVDFYNLAVRAIAGLRSQLPCVTGQLIAGPLFRDWHLLQLAEGISMIPFEPDMSARFARADLIISQAGYNTVAEIDMLRVRAVLVPADRQWDDQFARAERMSRGNNNLRTFRGKNPAELSALALELCQQEISPASAVLDAPGGPKAARLIYEMIQ